ncbi:MAG TPA: tripartite tricarboxylate transporter substrate binding protein [Burkholderiales bacterium]|nr:tripartite tricarboxylate transporter substrate binding protein [Burkholderiales bacterium]
MNSPARVLAGVATALFCAWAGAAVAQGYPNHPIKVLIPWPPGQATDLAARMVSEKLVPVLGQPMVADNKGGAGGTIGTEFASKQSADGYTILAGSSGPISISPNVQKVAYDPMKDFTPISLLAINPFVLVVNPSIPAKNVKELIALLRANPGKYSFSSSGSGATSHLMTVLFNSMAKVDAVHVPYKGSSQSVTDVVSGQVAYTIETVPAVSSFIKSGRLRALAVTSAKRSSALPEVPTIAEAGGLAGYDMVGWIGFLAPAGTPAAITDRLSAETRKVLQETEIRQKFLGLGLEPAGNTPAEFAEFIRKQSERYGAAVKAGNVKLD